MGLGQEWGDNLRAAVALGVQHGLTEQAGRAYVNLFGNFKATLRLAEADRLYPEAMAYCEEEDIATYGNCLFGERAECLELTGRWSEAEAFSHELLAKTDISPINKIHSWVVLSNLHVRRGAPDAEQTLESGFALADGVGEPQWLVPLGLARVEKHWLAGNLDAAATSLEIGDARRAGQPVERGAVAVWQRRLGVETTASVTVPPFDQQVAGEHAAAADRWEAIGNPYQAALAMLDDDVEDGWRRALEILDRSGPTPPWRAHAGGSARLVRGVPTTRRAPRTRIRTG